MMKPILTHLTDTLFLATGDQRSQSLLSLIFILTVWGTAICSAQKTGDWRNIEEGIVIPTPGMKYADQPYVVRTKDGTWICALTVGTLGETVKGSRNFSAVTTSRDQGKTWSPFIECNRTYAIPFEALSGRIYTITPGAFTWSDDGCRTWSQPVRIPQFTKYLGWGVGMPVLVDGEMIYPWAMVALSRPPRKTEVFFLKSRNIYTEQDLGKIDWKLLPADGKGLKGPDWDQPESRSEEPHVVVLNNRSLYCVFRTDQGYIGNSVSSDGGNTWSKPDALRYGPGERMIKNPLACPSLWKCSNGNYLLFFHNHNGRDYRERNPAWISGGVEKDGMIVWSEPEILLYSDDLTYHSGRLSYPGFLEDGGQYYLFETQKTTARMHQLDASLLEGCWNQASNKTLTTDGLKVELTAARIQANREIALPKFRDFTNGWNQDFRTGMTIELWIRFNSFRNGQVILENYLDNGIGLGITVNKDHSIRLTMNDGRTESSWPCDPVLKTGELQHLAIVIDGGPKTISYILNGKFLDGGEYRQYGWGRYHPVLLNVRGRTKTTLAPGLDGEIKTVRIYDRALRTSEVAGNYRAGWK